MDAKLTVVSTGKKDVTVHLRLKAKLLPDFSFDMDRLIKLEVVQGGADNG
ncbi:MAG: hypothetical protein ACI8XO_001035 [Verrucomicrobiales bacterium]|jgi:hypothetical protein